MYNATLWSRIHWSRWWRPSASHLVALVAGVALAIVFAPRAGQSINLYLDAPRPAAANEFQRALQSLMVQMADAMCITPSTDVDRDFARAMIPHHKGAVEMAKLELLYGSDPQLRRLAQGMIVEQAQEIALMSSILANTAPMFGANPNP